MEQPLKEKKQGRHWIETCVKHARLGLSNKEIRRQLGWELVEMTRKEPKNFHY